MPQPFGEVEGGGKLLDISCGHSPDGVIVDIVVDVPPALDGPFVILISPKTLHPWQKSVHIICFQLLQAGQFVLEYLCKQADEFLRDTPSAEFPQLAKNASKITVLIEHFRHLFLAPGGQLQIPVHQSLQKSFLGIAAVFCLETEDISILENRLFLDGTCKAVFEEGDDGPTEQVRVVAVYFLVEAGFKVRPGAMGGSEGGQGSEVVKAGSESTAGEGSADLVLDLNEGQFIIDGLVFKILVKYHPIDQFIMFSDFYFAVNQQQHPATQTITSLIEIFICLYGGDGLGLRIKGFIHIYFDSPVHNLLLWSMIKDKEYPADLVKQYKYFDDPRGEWEVQLTNRLARTISDLNFQQLETPLRQSLPKSIKKQDFLYVCINGWPPMEKQFDFLQLPGECLTFQSSVFDNTLTDQEMFEKPIDFDILAQQLHKKISEGSKNKPIIMVYHSFGTYIFANYCRLFNYDRIIGIIDIGGAPIRFYPFIQTFFNDFRQTSIDFVKENIDIIYLNYVEANNKVGIRSCEKKQQMLGILRAFKSQPGFKEMFEYIRNLPKLLKCFIYGRKDRIFPQILLNEKMVYFAYTNKFEATYEAQLQKTYQRCVGSKCDNVQERFIYSMEGGHHSLHLQNKYKEVNAKIIHRYLMFIEEMYAEKGANL